MRNLFLAFTSVITLCSYVLAAAGVDGGNTNRGFIPRYCFVEGFYVCSDFAEDYCNQFIPRENCSVVLVEWPGGGHSFVRTRVPIGGGEYRYCLVEPQRNRLIPNSCWTDGPNPDWGIPGTPRESACRYYREWNFATCDKWQWWVFPRMPRYACHESVGGCRGYDPPNKDKPELLSIPPSTENSSNLSEKSESLDW